MKTEPTDDLRTEIKQTKPFSSIEEEILLRLIRTGDRLQYEINQLLKTRKLTITQYNALRILRGAGEAGLPCHDIGDRMITKVPDVTRLLDRLEENGLVIRARQTDDRRVVRVRISTAGLALLQSLDEPMRQFHKQQVTGLNADNLSQFNDLLRRIRLGKKG
ncbi:MarR family transcriptional regulator [Candidatus Sumerlaeota bacterium]|nr:MarR family transcriptional regulator [Candidatus Sumerlaeota bacterium]